MSSGGANLQVIARGKQDVYLTGNPQKTFFKTVYARHTNFAVESKPIYFDGTPNFGQRITAVIPRAGDLLGKMYLHVRLPPLKDALGNPVPYTHNIGHAIIKEISVQIGEQEIDRQTGEWMEISSRLRTSLDHRDAFDAMVSGTSVGDTSIYRVPTAITDWVSLMVPLQFWFCNNPGLALPLVALQYHPVRINIKLRPLSELALIGINDIDECTRTSNVTTSPAGVLPTFTLWADYIHLDVEERRRFVDNTHEYLIEQVQYTPITPVPRNTLNATIPIDFNHPVKELLWVVQKNLCRLRNEHFNWSNKSIFDGITSRPGDNLSTAVLMLDGKERFDKRDAPYFRLVQPYEHHSRVDLDYLIYCYSFALRPEDIQPSGSVNMTLMNTVNLNLELANSIQEDGMSVTVYGTNMNVLRIVTGLGGLLFKV
jgi:hypothetical protein